MKNQYKQKISLLCFLAALFIIQLGYSQNLVRNPSFEQGAVPSAESQLQFATHWSHYKGECTPNNPSSPITKPSSDLFDANSSFAPIGVPSNKWTTASGLAERTGQNRYAGIDSRSFSSGQSVSEERIRGTLVTSLQPGGYNLSLFLARAKNKYSPSAPQLDPANFYSIEVVLRQGNHCNINRVIYTSPNITNFQWQQFSTSFIITQAEANNFDRVEIRMRQFPYNEIGEFNARSMFIDDVNISPVVCNLNPAFSANITCNESSNTVSINVNNTGTNPTGTAHQYNIYEMNSNSTADANIVSTTGYINAVSGSYNVPNIGGKYYMIKHGVWTSTCNWREQRKVLRIPYSFNGVVNSNFSGAINSPSNGSPYINVNTTVTSNTVSNWIVFKNAVNTYPNLSSWGLHTLVYSNTPTHNYNVPNIQNGIFYLVRHVSRTNCSQYDYTDKIFYVFAKSKLSGKGKKELEYELVSESTNTVSEEEHKENMKKLSFMKEETDKTQLVQLYPNPSRANVILNSNLNLDDAQVKITNRYGKVIYNSIWKNGNSINVSSWNKGLYIVTIKTEKEKIYKKLLVE